MTDRSVADGGQEQRRHDVVDVDRVARAGATVDQDERALTHLLEDVGRVHRRPGAVDHGRLEHGHRNARASPGCQRRTLAGQLVVAVRVAGRRIGGPLVDVTDPGQVVDRQRADVHDERAGTSGRLDDGCGGLDVDRPAVRDVAAAALGAVEHDAAPLDGAVQGAGVGQVPHVDVDGEAQRRAPRRDPAHEDPHLGTALLHQSFDEAPPEEARRAQDQHAGPAQSGPVAHAVPRTAA
jgi:hypothetical protein